MAAAISTKSSWLKDNALELVECPLSRETLPQLSHTAVDAVLSSDILLLAFSDADDPQTCAALMQQFRHHPSLLILVNQLVSTRPDSFKAQMATHLSTSSTVPVLSFDSRQAFALSENNTLSSYTDDLSSSHTTQVAQSLVNQAASANPSSSLRMVLRQAVQVIEDARKESTFAIQTSSDACQAATSAVEALHQQSYLNVQPSLPQQAKDHSRAVFEYAFNKRLAWWKLPFGRADDVMAELGQAAQVAWKRSESHTLFEAGRFEGLRQELDASTDVLASIPPLQLGGPYHSAVLRNQVEQLVESGRTRISVDDALEPYEQRRKQVIGPGGLAESAYRQAQTVVLGNYLVLLGTSAASYMSVLAEVAQWPTAATGGAFGAVWASWRLQKGWEKVKRRFLANLDRLHDGLAEDLSVSRCLFNL